MLLVNLLLYIISFVGIWFGAGLIISSVDRFSRKLHFSSFIVSFVILGLLTSTPEFAVGLTAVAEKNPEVFIGNLLGGIPVLFLFVIPLLAILGNGITLKHELNNTTILATLGVILAPPILILDKKITGLEGGILIALYCVLIFLVQRQYTLFANNKSQILNTKAYSYKDMLKIIVGIGIVFVTSHIIVDQTLYFSTIFSISPFLISLIFLSIGTNLPELSLAIRSIIRKKKDIAFGDYLGSAAANTFLFGLFTVLSNGEIITINNYLITFCFILFGLITFYIFSKSNNIITRKEGLILLGAYALFIFYEFVQ